MDKLKYNCNKSKFISKKKQECMNPAKGGIDAKKI